jgi:septal ring factor EnvC (AmiA/AmiB activator)
LQVRSEAVAAAQEKLEATKTALERRKEELRALEAGVRKAARAAEAAERAAAARDAELRRREVHRPAQPSLGLSMEDCESASESGTHLLQPGTDPKLMLTMPA